MENNSSNIKEEDEKTVVAGSSNKEKSDLEDDKERDYTTRGLISR